MYEKDGEKYFVVDGHIHHWDASPANQANRYGEGFINCFYDYHRNLSPKSKLWTLEQFWTQSKDQIIHDLFVDGYDDVAIFQPTYLTDFYVNGFNTTEQNGALAEKHPGKFVVNGSFDPRDGELGLDELTELADRWNLKGVKLYTAEWKGESKGYKLSDPMCYRYLERCMELGIKNIHVHKGPTIYPLNRDAFDVADVDDAASEFPDLNFIVDHVGLPRLEDSCWIATQEPNVYGGLAVALPLIETRPRYWAQIIGELKYWIGADRILFGSDYAIWTPRWLTEALVDFQMPENLLGEYAPVTRATRPSAGGCSRCATTSRPWTGTARWSDAGIDADLDRSDRQRGLGAVRRPGAAPAGAGRRQPLRNHGQGDRRAAGRGPADGVPPADDADRGRLPGPPRAAAPLRPRVPGPGARAGPDPTTRSTARPRW